MNKKSIITRYRIGMQSIILLFTFLIGIRHLLPGEVSRGGAFDAFCPFGGIETLWSFIAYGQTLNTTNLLNFSILIAVLGVSLVAGRAFCGWMCPIGTMQDFLTKIARQISGGGKKTIGKKSKSLYPKTMPSKIDKWLRYLKYLILVWVLAASIAAVYPPLFDLCPARALFVFKWNTPLLGVVLVVFVGSSLLYNRFSCKYLCPLGAILGVFNKISPVHISINNSNCSDCGRCENECIVDIPDLQEKIRSTECVRCLECLETCSTKDVVELRIY